MVGTAYLIGSGRYNTERLAEYMDIDGMAYSGSLGAIAEYAAKKCLDYSNNGYDDWFLPGREELFEMYKALKCPGGTNHSGSCPDRTHAVTSTEETRNSFANDYYWSSSESEGYYRNAWRQYFSGGYQNDDSRYYCYFVRAVRAF